MFAKLYPQLFQDTEPSFQINIHVSELAKGAEWKGWLVLTYDELLANLSFIVGFIGELNCKK